MALRGPGWGVGIQSAMENCFPKPSSLCASQEEVLGLSQRAWLPGVQKETSSVPGWRSWGSDSGTKWETEEPQNEEGGPSECQTGRHRGSKKGLNKRHQGAWEQNVGDWDQVWAGGTVRQFLGWSVTPIVCDRVRATSTVSSKPILVFVLALSKHRIPTPRACIEWVLLIFLVQRL